MIEHMVSERSMFEVGEKKCLYLRILHKGALKCWFNVHIRNAEHRYFDWRSNALTIYRIEHSKTFEHKGHVTVYFFQKTPNQSTSSHVLITHFAFTLWTKRIMPSYFSQLEFPVVSGQHTVSKYRSLVHMFSYKLAPFSCRTKSQLVSFSLNPKNCIHFSVQFSWILCLYLVEPTDTGQVNVTCPVGSTLSWSAEFKHRNISANAVHIWGDWQHLKGHWGGKTVMLISIWMLY
jgi:hypothetical protein